ncbi:hypothetical protein PCCS19_50810 [Paenibacillus sp. CCS19]|uniref:hypothetical protein n=1 Tax=Paenibacillus sp. CCS19 TaxID=3158387 RepID=UPI00256B6F34|nr:hypothetical protein [Paenibacillus cellulosilyticus]GMK42022.1 hypothetical protein PCCS19_50810 [Paenibacillus cellulosilyticus]
MVRPLNSIWNKDKIVRQKEAVIPPKTMFETKSTVEFKDLQALNRKALTSLKQ